MYKYTYMYTLACGPQVWQQYLEIVFRASLSKVFFAELFWLGEFSALRCVKCARQHIKSAAQHIKYAIQHVTHAHTHDNTWRRLYNTSDMPYNTWNTHHNTWNMHYYVCITVYNKKYTHDNTWYSTSNMGWLRLVGSLKLQVSFAEYRLFYRALLQKRPIILRSLLMVATPYSGDSYPSLSLFSSLCLSLSLSL